jgi:hypothetical protein
MDSKRLNHGVQQTQKGLLEPKRAPHHNETGDPTVSERIIFRKRNFSTIYFGKISEKIHLLVGIFKPKT